MRFNAMALYAAAFAAALLMAGAARAEETPLGLWIDHTGRGAVEIKECDGHKLCGNIVWLKDSKNNEACGRQVIGDAKPVGGGKWDNGWIYDPDSESKYDVELTPLGDKLRVVGYAGSKWLSETMTWTRAPADLQRCTKDAAAAASPEKQTTAEKQSDGKSATADAKQAAATPPAPNASADTKVEAKAADKPTNEARTESELAPSAGPSDKSASASDDPDEGASDRPRRKGEALKKITQALNLRKLKDGRCKMDVPFVDMQVTFDCEQ
jgi:uncharacterized protein (DUF2147 family)